MIETIKEKSKGTGVTEGTSIYTNDCSGSTIESTEGTNGTAETNKPAKLQLEAMDFGEVLLNKPSLDINRPCYRVHDDWFNLNGHKKQPGLYWHGYTTKQEPIDIWVCTPIHAVSITADVHDESFGLLLRFINPFGNWREWAMPMHLLKGSCDDLRGELLHLGVKINQDAKKHLNGWLMQQRPKTQIIAAMQTGWSCDGKSFVLPNKTFGDTRVRFQSEHAAYDDFIQQGDINEWRESIALKCRGNPVLMLSVSAALAAPLVFRAKQQAAGGGGIHLVGKSSNGKTTALQIAASVWGGSGYVRAWRATANGLEATAAGLNDCLLVLDEIGECDPREIGSIIYALANGQGKQRAQRTGISRKSARWRTIVLSSGERTLSAHMQEAGQSIKAGQEARLLSIPVTDRLYGVFDDLQGLPDGRSFADNLKQATCSYYGVSGPAFIEKLLADNECLPELYARACNHPAFSSSDGVESRAASMFALVALAGEKATEYGLTGWKKGEAYKAAIEMFNVWREYRGQGQTEARQIQQAIRHFIDRHGDSRFSELGRILDINDESCNDTKFIVRDRAGYWKDTSMGRIFMFNSGALQEAATGFDLKCILRTLKEIGWIAEHDYGKNSKRVKVGGRAIVLYWLMPNDAE